MLTRSSIAVFVLALHILTVRGIQCGCSSCPDGNECCNDAVMGPTCYDPTGYSCANNGASTFRLCGQGLGACGGACYDTSNYFCCNGQIAQNGQSCSGATTAAPTSSPTTAAPTNAPSTTPCYGDDTVIQCAAGTVCCGNGTIFPSCMTDDGSKKCCVWYLGATQCNASDVCGGEEGPGASSAALCGPPDSVFCNQGLGINKFCTADQVCCGTTEMAWCCPHGDSCGTYESPCQTTAGSTSSEYFCNSAQGGASFGTICEAGQVCCQNSLGANSYGVNYCCPGGTSNCGNSTYQCM